MFPVAVRVREAREADTQVAGCAQLSPPAASFPSRSPLQPLSVASYQLQMGNCLPVIFGHRRQNNESTPQSMTSRSETTSSTSMSFTNPVMQLPNSSAYVNQLYAANMARQRTAASDVKELDDARRVRVKGLLEQIPADVFRQDMKMSECAICIVDFEVGERVRFLPCMHSFHQACVDDWLMRSFTCPSCTEPVDSTILSSLTAHTQQSLRDLAFSPAQPSGQ